MPRNESMLIPHRLLLRASLLGGCLVVSLLTTAQSTAHGAGSTKDQFSMEFFRRVAAQDKTTNLVVSPYSVSETLAMVTAGTNGQTKQQTVASLAGYGIDVDPLRRANLRASLTQDNETGTGTEVLIANAIWIDGITLSNSYRRTLESNFAAPATQVPFKTKPQQAVLKINGWISKSTDNKVPVLLGANQVNKNTIILPTNAIHMFGRWATPFDKSKTRTAPFRRADGKNVQSPRMTGMANVSLSASPRIISLPYTSGTEMRLVVPSTSTPRNLDEAMTALHRSVTQQEQESTCLDVVIQLPKWRANTRTSVRPALESMGIVQLFNPNADYSAMTDKASPGLVQLTNLVHAGAINVDEEGTTASAATAATLDAVEQLPSPDTCPTEVIVDRPFVYVIQQINDGEILFAGRVNDPTR